MRANSSIRWFLGLLSIAIGASGRAADLAQLEQQAIREAVAAAANSVVQIRTVGGLDEVDGAMLSQGPTTGIILTADGYIVSSAINFAQEPTSVVIRLPDGQQRPAEIVGRDFNRMLVLLKVEVDQPLSVAEPADLQQVRPGDWAIALGRTHEAERVGVSVGVVSALGRMHGRALQTDANVSAANYGGPLVDIHGRVLGILAPMSPQSAGADEPSALAGAEYYDSGIGFAIPLADVLSVLDRWKAEKDLQRGLLGIGMKQGNAHATAPVVTAVWPGSPAAAAGWKVGDRIVSIEGEPVNSQTALRFAVVPHYAGDALQVTIRRGKKGETEVIETTVTLAGELPKFKHAFLGILPERSAAGEPGEDAKATEAPSDDDDADDGVPSDAAEGRDEEEKKDNESVPDEETEETPDGIVVRAVWPGSPAKETGLQPGDRITHLGEEAVDSIGKALAALNAKCPGDVLAVKARRGDEELDLSAKLAELPIEALEASELPRSSASAVGDANEGDALELAELKLPEMPQTARYLEPAVAGPAPGLLLWLGDGKPETAARLAKDWQAACRRDGLILLIAVPGDQAGWTGDDMEYLGRLLQTALQRFQVDPRRIVIAGEGKGGQLAYALAFKAREVVRGVIAIDSPLPRTLELPDNGPNARLAVVSIETQNSPLALVIRQDLSKLQEAGYPATRITRRSDGAPSATLGSATRSELRRWIDGLDRF